MFTRSFHEIGDKIILKEDVSTMAGTFSECSELKITGFSDHGMDLVDGDCNKIIEFGRLNEQYELIIINKMKNEEN